MKKETGKNVSSGAKKVERIEEYTQQSVDPAPKKEGKKTTAKKTTQKVQKPKTKNTAELREEVAADRRVKAAEVRAEKKKQKLEKKTSLKQAKVEKRAALKEKKLQKKQAVAEKKLARKELLAKKKADRIAAKEKRRADHRERRAERRAERTARRELLKNETKAEREKRIAREKKDRAALKRQRAAAREKAQSERRKARNQHRAQKRAERREKRERKAERRTPGFGGWLAAVISLGTACLVLGAIVTAGAFRMNEMNIEADGGYRNTFYELVSTGESLDDDLGKLRISSGVGEQRTLLTDIVVQSALMESALERMPVGFEAGASLSSFVNKTGEYARTLLDKVNRGNALTSSEKEQLLTIYENNGKIYEKLNELATHLDAGEFKEFVSGGQGAISELFGEMGGSLKEEITDAPFTGEGNVGENRLTGLEEVTSSQAEQAAKEYFAAYHVREVKYTGETLAADMQCYNFVLTDENDVEIFAEITKSGAKLAFFDTYEECNTKNFDLDTCDAIAREYLSTLGIEDVEAVWLSDAGMVANLTYTTVQGGVRVYPEMIRVRVCEEKGRVIGMDAREYLLNNGEHEFEGGMSEREARGMLSEGLTPYAVNRALIAVNGRETLAYEFACTYGEDEYIVYLDAETGEEVRIFRVQQSANGSYLR